MEIKTTKAPRETAVPEAEQAPEKNRYLRRKPAQQIRKSYPASRGWIRSLRFLGKTAILLAAVALLVSVVIYAFTSEQFRLRAVSVHGSTQVEPGRIEGVIRAEFQPRYCR